MSSISESSQKDKDKLKPSSNLEESEPKELESDLKNEDSDVAFDIALGLKNNKSDSEDPGHTGPHP